MRANIASTQQLPDLAETARGLHEQQSKEQSNHQWLQEISTKQGMHAESFYQ